jgi:hypothetical protein
MLREIDPILQWMHARASRNAINNLNMKNDAAPIASLRQRA